MRNTLTIADCQSEDIFYVENGKVIESSYYDYLLEFGQGDDTSSIEEKDRTFYKIEENEFDSETEATEFAEENGLDVDLIEEFTKTFYQHVVRYHANYGCKIKSKGWESENIEEVEREFIQGLIWFVSEKNWDAPEYFDSSEEADNSRISLAAESMGIDVEVFLSIERKQNIVYTIRKERMEASAQAFRLQEAVVFEKYKNIIERIEGESYKETQDRLAKALPEKIKGSTFHKIIKQLR